MGVVQNAIDGLVETFAPERGARRAMARQQMAVIRQTGYSNYGASTTKNSLRGWLYSGGDAKADIEDNLDILRQRSRDAYMGVPLAASAIKTMRTHVVGSGLVPKPQIDSTLLHITPQAAEQLQEQITREFGIWANSANCDAARIDNFYQLQQLAFLSYAMNGDVLALLPMKQRPGWPYSLTVQLIEADRLCNPHFAESTQPRIIQGVELDGSGEAVAYHICNIHPLATSKNAPDGTPMTWQRIPAYGKASGRRNVLHVMTRERVGQVRGVPMLAPVLDAIKSMGRYLDAEQQAALVNALWVVYITKDAPADNVKPGQFVAPQQQIAPDDEKALELGSGTVWDLNPGEKPEAIDPKHPTGNFGNFMDSLTKQIGAALETPAEVLEKSFNSNYSAARGAFNEFWQTVEMQRDWLVDDFCQPIYEEWLAEAVALGRISAPGFFDDPAVRAAYCRCEWSGPAQIQIDPVKEVTAAKMRVENCFSTAEKETAALCGGSYAANIRQRKIEEMQKKEVYGNGEQNQNPGGAQ